MPTKICRKCQQTLPLNAFGRRKTSYDGYRNICRQCHNTRSRERYHADPERRKKQISDSYLWIVNNPEQARAIRLAYYQRRKQKRLMANQLPPAR